MFSYFLLFHQLRIWAIVYHALAKNWGRQRCIDRFRIDIFQLSIQYEFVSFRAQTHGDFFAEENKGKYITILGL